MIFFLQSTVTKFARKNEWVSQVSYKPWIKKQESFVITTLLLRKARILRSNLILNIRIYKVIWWHVLSVACLIAVIKTKGLASPNPSWREECWTMACSGNVVPITELSFLMKYTHSMHPLRAIIHCLENTKLGPRIYCLHLLWWDRPPSRY